ncbi:NAD-dependent epimerase/dehydratase family protein [Nonlabens agnitus]|uniref:3-beta hydroxysteroid dehydrogenase n=1 Tax=Nonlabens agnitus TaxID=870484 RepID=A0A2S9WS73_9FLAO|nr:NAD-dependent epimerase/dehydratase family protein [Nonlabens agnitus]PRP66334.1 3-beta hydroxysteroid dehydrogenase [Nonlabens agnitus]
MKILITGIAGFIGSHLAERLHANHHEVIGIDNFSDYYDVTLKRENAAALSQLDIKVMELDLREDDLEAALPKDVEYIFHAAALPGIASTSTFEQYLTNNVIATHRLTVAAAHLAQLKMFVNIGTSSIYGKDVFCDEEQMAKPISNYGVTKLAAEQLVMSQSRLGNYPACSLRLYSVYGSRERPDKMFSQLINCAIHGEKFSLFEGSLEHKRSFTHITDIIDGIVSTIGKEDVCDGQVINLGTDQEYTTAQGIQTVEKLMDTKIGIDLKPARSGDQLRTKAVIDKAKKLLDYNPQVGLEEGVQEQINWFEQ